MRNNTTILKQSYETMGNNSVDVQIEHKNGQLTLLVCLTEFNPFERKMKQYKMSDSKNWINNDFIYYLKKVITSELPY